MHYMDVNIYINKASHHLNTSSPLQTICPTQRLHILIPFPCHIHTAHKTLFMYNGISTGLTTNKPASVSTRQEFKTKILIVSFNILNHSQISHTTYHKKRSMGPRLIWLRILEFISHLLQKIPVFKRHLYMVNSKRHLSMINVVITILTYLYFLETCNIFVVRVPCVVFFLQCIIILFECYVNSDLEVVRNRFGL